MKMRMYDTMTRGICGIEPMDGRTFRFYCCGPTVYGPAHVGNFRTFLLQDVFRRTLESTGTETKHVRNITDVDDKTIRGSMEEGIPLGEFTKRWADRFHADCTRLDMLAPHVELSAVATIDKQVALIRKLVDSGVAYASEDGSVYYDVSAFPPYGKLSRLHEREIHTTAGSRACCQAHDADEYDRDSAADFALWKAHRPEDGENEWPSPWGKGRPGWHIECSAMSMEHLGESFDMHGGGMDLIFPHHENEIAQSEAATGKIFAKHWFHIAHLMVDGRKMSKSLGNLFTLDDVEQRGFAPADLRYLLVSGHYRQPLNFTWESMQAATRARQKIGKIRARVASLATGESSPEDPFVPAWHALLDDLNTPDAIGKTFTTLNGLDRAIAAGELTGPQAVAALRGLDRVVACLGITIPEPSNVTASDGAPPEIAALAQKRWEAKQARDFSAADALREEILSAGWTIRDAPDGFILGRA